MMVRPARNKSFSAPCMMVLIAVVAGAAQWAEGRPCREFLIPNGVENSCFNCHIEPAGPRNAFGLDVEKVVRQASCDSFWGPALALLDSDGDGLTNGEELLDPDGIWTPTAPDPGDPMLVSNPGDANDPTAQPTPPPPPINLREITDGLLSPVFVTHAGDGSGRLFILEKDGAIKIVQEGQLLAAPFLNLRAKVQSTGFEQGLLGLAFHPDFSNNLQFFVTYTRTSDGFLQIERYEIDPGDPDRADPESAKTILEIEQSSDRHHGGMIEFGPLEDGDNRYLYISVGDSQGNAVFNPDSPNISQNLQSLLGKLLRIDIDHGDPYSSPSSNPFFAITQSRNEIYVLGLRNPWRFSIDHETGRIFVGDVGQALYEEIDLITPGGNYGWPILEGESCFNNGFDPMDQFFPLAQCNPPPGAISPIYVYPHPFADPDFPGGESVTGGYVYRGDLIPWLQGKYVFGDFFSNRIWAMTEQPEGSWTVEELLQVDQAIQGFSGLSSFGVDQDGELYVCDFLGGRIFQIINNIPTGVRSWPFYD